MRTNILIFILAFCWIKHEAQTVGYNYDLHGNRIQRVLGASSTNKIANNDSVPSYDEGTMKLAMEYGVSVFPNPTQTNINVVTNKLPADAAAIITLYDNTGRILKVMPDVAKLEEISLEAYPPGIYVISIVVSNTNDRMIYKIIKQ